MTSMLPTTFNAQDRKVRVVKHVCYQVIIWQHCQLMAQTKELWRTNIDLKRWNLQTSKASYYCSFDEEKVFLDWQNNWTLSETCGKLGQKITLIPLLELWCTIPSCSTLHLCKARYLMYSIALSSMEAMSVWNENHHFHQSFCHRRSQTKESNHPFTLFVQQMKNFTIRSAEYDK